MNSYPDKRSPIYLAARVGCAVEELPGLIAVLPDRPPWSRRREAFVLRYEHRWTFRRIAGHFGVTAQAVSLILQRGINDLRAAREGRLGLDYRVMAVLGVWHGAGAAQEAVTKLDCRAILKLYGSGEKTLRVILDWLRPQTLRLRCGCPAAAPCWPSVIDLVARKLRRAAGATWVPRVRVIGESITLEDDGALGPMVIGVWPPGARLIPPRWFPGAPPALVIEHAQAERERTTLYAREGVSECWRIDLAARRIRVFVFWGECSDEERDFVASDSIVSEVFDRLPIRVGDLLP